jgi:hypothetical protein
MLRLYSRRTWSPLRAALPMRLALPHLEPVLVLNVGKEVEKDTAVILDAGNPATGTDQEKRLADCCRRPGTSTAASLTRSVDSLSRSSSATTKSSPFRARRIRLLHEAAQKISCGTIAGPAPRARRRRVAARRLCPPAARVVPPVRRGSALAEPLGAPAQGPGAAAGNDRPRVARRDAASRLAAGAGNRRTPIDVRSRA